MAAFSLCPAFWTNHVQAQAVVDPLKQAQQFEQKAIAAYKEKKYSEFLDNAKQAFDLRPNHPRLTYTLAVAYSVNGRRAESLKLLGNLAAMGLSYRPEKDTDFSVLESSEEFVKIISAFERNRQPINRSGKFFALAEKDLITESIAYDAKTRRFFIGSIRKRKIVAVDSAGKAADFSAPADGLWSVFGMKVDEKRRLLWVCSSAVPQMVGFLKADDGASGIFKYDLDTGKLLKKYPLDNQSEKHLLGDLTVSTGGDVYATDSTSPNIYSIDRQSDELKIFLTDNSFAALQGVTFTPDEKYLFVADYSKGVFRIEVKSKRVEPLLMPENVTALGIDGLYFYRGKLVAVQNGVNPQRIIRLTLDSKLSRLTASETLEANIAQMTEPTLGVIIGSKFHFIANAQWEMVNEKGEIFAPENLTEPLVLQLSL